MWGLGIKETIIISIVFFILFGIKKSPQLIKQVIGIIGECKGLFQMKK
jgi:Sec-independent protein translocase protein TatA